MFTRVHARRDGLLLLEVPARSGARQAEHGEGPPDVSSSTPHYGSIIMLFEAGVVSGNDDSGTFTPGSTMICAVPAALSRGVLEC